jgi:ABC-type transport system involved in multi-copper enzyme maturation permease subunit
MTAAAQRPKEPSSPDPPIGVGDVARLVLVLAPAALVAWLLALVLWPPGIVVALALLFTPLLLTRRWFRFSGSLVFYELLRAARRDRNVVFRCLYTCLLLGVLCWFYLSWFGSPGEPLWKVLLGEHEISAAQMPRFAGHFFTTFLAAQLAAVLLVTPVYAAGVIAEEKEHRTLEFLLATPLSNSEILLSKLAARLANLVPLLLAGLPVLALTQLWGGVDPLLLADGFVVTVPMLLSVGCLSAFNSVRARTSLEALLRTYGMLAAFLLAGACIPGVNFAHPVVLLWIMSDLASHGDTASTQVMFFGGAGVYLIAAVLCVGGAIRDLRAVVLYPLPLVPGREPPPTGTVSGPPRRPPLGDGKALLWKELYAESLWRPDQLPGCLAVPVVILGVTTAVSGVVAFLMGALVVREPVLGPMNVWTRACGTAFACALVLVTAAHAARAVSRERERQTLDSLRCLPDDDAALLAAKWLGSLGSTRRAWWWLGAIWAGGVITGALVPLAVPLLALACGVYAGFAAALGLYFSTVCRTTLRATLATALALLAVVGVPWVLWDLGELVLPPGPAGRWLMSFQHDGLTPPMPLWALAFGYEEVDTDLAAWAGRVLAGLACYAAAAWLLWRRALARFAGDTGRTPPPGREPRPERGKA